MSKVVNEAYRGLALTDIQAACVLFELDIDGHKGKLPPSVKMLAEQLPKPDKVWQEHRPGITYTFNRWTPEYLRAWAEKDGRYRPALLFGAPEAAVEIDPDDFDQFKLTDPRIQLFARILWASDKGDGSGELIDAGASRDKESPGWRSENNIMGMVAKAMLDVTWTRARDIARAVLGIHKHVTTKQ
jgi:hypothetical protein